MSRWGTSNARSALRGTFNQAPTNCYPAVAAPRSAKVPLWWYRPSMCAAGADILLLRVPAVVVLANRASEHVKKHRSVPPHPPQPTPQRLVCIAAGAQQTLLHGASISVLEGGDTRRRHASGSWLCALWLCALWLCARGRCALCLAAHWICALWLCACWLCARWRPLLARRPGPAPSGSVRHSPW